MSDSAEESSVEAYRMVIVHQSGVESSNIVLLRGDILATVAENLMRTGVFRDVRFEPAPGADAGPLFPPEAWNGVKPLPVDDELPPLDRPKIP